MKNNKALLRYQEEIKALSKYCEDKTELTPVLLDGEYPFRVQFIPNAQMSMFGNENIDENGEFNDLIITVGLTTTVKSTLKFKMDSKQIKKLLKMAEVVGNLYYQAFREEAGTIIRDDDYQEMLRDALANASAAGV